MWRDNRDRSRRSHPASDGFEDELAATIPPGSMHALANVETERTLAIPVPEVDARATLTVMSGANAGRVCALNHRDTVLGRGPTVDLTFEDAAISRVHARISCEADGYVLEDLGSTNGTLLKGARVTRAPVASGDRFQLGPNVVLRFAVTDRLERDLLTRLVESSTRDALTGALNRAFFVERLETELAYATRHATKVAVLFVDIDHFKAINDSYGHAAGDEVLRQVAGTLGRNLRAEDLLARYGGEEFAILARAQTRLDAHRVAQRVKEAVAALEVAVTPDAKASVTISIGVASLSELPDVRSAADLLRLADERLYKAKAAGRNTICGGG